MKNRYLILDEQKLEFSLMKKKISFQDLMSNYINDGCELLLPTKGKSFHDRI